MVAIASCSLSVFAEWTAKGQQEGRKDPSSVPVSSMWTRPQWHHRGQLGKGVMAG